MEARYHKKNKLEKSQYHQDNFSRGSNAMPAGAKITSRPNTTKWYHKDATKNIQQLSRSNSVSSESSTIRWDSTELNNYVCPKCKVPYNYIISNNRLTGKVPRILPCKHTLCEECIFKNSKIIQCPICLDTGLDRKQSCEYNYYILGQITHSRFSGTRKEINLALTSTDTKSHANVETVEKNKCGFQNCTNSVMVTCKDCCDVYCQSCDDSFHKQDERLMSHKRVPLKNESFELGTCAEHSIHEDIFCNDCNLICCCYCFLDKHEGHTRSYLGRLNDVEEAQLLELYEKAKASRKQLVVSQKKISKMERTDAASDLEVEISRSFADIHAQLHFLEKRIQEEAQLGNNNCNLTFLSESIKWDIQALDKLIHSVEERKTVKLNLKVLLSKLKEMENLPTVLVTEQKSESPFLLIDKEIYELEKYIKLDIPKEFKYKLEKVDELPAEYQEEIVEKSDEPQPNSSQNNVSRTPTKMAVTDDAYRQQIVYITHINSLDSFYVQLKEDDNQFKQMEQEIWNHVTKTKIKVTEVQLKELYLAKRLGDRNRWSRVRIMESYETEGEEKYVAKFIDFGNVAVINKDELLYISTRLAEKKPFAFECRLENPSQMEWPKDTHLELAKLLDSNKELFMFVKNASNQISTVVLHLTTSIGGSCSVTDLLIFGCDALKNSKVSPMEKSPSNNIIYNNSDVFTVGSSYDVYIRYFVDVNHIYIQKTSNEHYFRNMITQMKRYYSNSKSNIHLPVKNSYVVSYYPTNSFGCWHRSKILEVYEKNKTVDVFLVDLGILTNVYWNKIRNLFELFKKFECLIVCVKLADVAPLHQKTYNKKNAKEYFSGYSFKTIEMKMLVSNNDPLEVVLFEPFQNYNLNINAVLVQNNLAVSTGKLTNTKMWLHTEEEKNEENDVLFIKDDSEDEHSEDTVDGFMAQVEIVSFENPFSFYVSFISKKAEAEKLNEELQIHYKSTIHHFKHQEKWKENDKVVVYDKSDNMFYRGVIHSIEGNKYLVNLSDKPDYLWVHAEKMRVMHPYFKNNFPNMIIKCHMVSIKPAGDSTKWSHLSLEWFSMMFKKHNDIFLQKIDDQENKTSLPVALWYSKLIQGTALEPSYRKYFSIEKKVVNLGLAFWVSNEAANSISPKRESPTVIKRKTSFTDDSPLLSSIENSKETHPVPVMREIKTVSFEDWQAPYELKVKEFFAYITCAENEGYLFVREEKMQKCYEDLEKNMKEYFDVTPTQPFRLRENQMVTVRSEGSWYRSTVLKVIDKNTAKIIMVDFGSDHIVTMEDIHNKIMYPEIPILVTKIKLYDIKSKNKTWTALDVDTLIDQTPEYAKIIIRSSSYEGIPLADVYNSKGVCLNDKLVELCPNLYRPKQSMFVVKSDNLESVKNLNQPEAEKHYKHVIKTDIQAEPKNKSEDSNKITPEKHYGTAKKIDGQISPHKHFGNSVLIEEENSPKHSDNCDVIEEGIQAELEIYSQNQADPVEVQENNDEILNQHQANEEIYFEDVKEEQYEDIEQKENCENDINLTIKEQLTVNQNEYKYAEFTYEVHEMDILSVYDYKTISLYHPNSSSQKNDFEALTKTIRENVDSLGPLENIKVGQPCLCLFEEDNQWYRAKLIQIDSQLCGYVTVIYVDYGNFEVVKLSDLKAMRPEWLDFPASYVDGVIPYKLVKKEQENILSKHIQLLAGTTKPIEIVNKNPVLLHVYDTDELKYYYDIFVKNEIVQIAELHVDD